eukprot:gene23852-biopygen10394
MRASTCAWMPPCLHASMLQYQVSFVSSRQINPRLSVCLLHRGTPHRTGGYYTHYLPTHPNGPMQLRKTGSGRLYRKHPVESGVGGLRSSHAPRLCCFSNGLWESNSILERICPCSKSPLRRPLLRGYHP